MYKNELELAISISREAGQVMLEHFESGIDTQIKDDGSLVTVADKKINDLVIDRISKVFTDDSIIGEEKSHFGDGIDRIWFCDPIDGTRAFAWGIPTATFSLGLTVNNMPRLGVVYDPFLDRLYTATKGKGAFCNKKPLNVSSAKELLNERIFVTNSINDISKGLNYINELIDKGSDLANPSGGIYTCLLVARGEATGAIKSKVHRHDMAAAQLIVEEAGGKITDLVGEELNYSKPFQGAIISNGFTHSELVKVYNT